MNEAKNKSKIKIIIPITTLLLSIILTIVFLPKKEPEVTNPNSFIMNDEISFIGKPTEIYNIEIPIGEVEERTNISEVVGDQRNTLDITLSDLNNNQLYYSFNLYYDQIDSEIVLYQPELMIDVVDGVLIYSMNIIDEGTYIIIVDSDNPATQEFTLFKSGTSALPIDLYAVIWLGFMGSIVSIGVLMESLINPTSNTRSEEIYVYKRKSKAISKDFHNPFGHQ